MTAIGPDAASVDMDRHFAPQTGHKILPALLAIRREFGTTRFVAIPRGQHL
jgi:hypothetical protein